MIKKILLLLMLTGCQTSYVVDEFHEIKRTDRSFCFGSYECEDEIYWLETNTITKF